MTEGKDICYLRRWCFCIFDFLGYHFQKRVEYQVMWYFSFFVSVTVPQMCLSLFLSSSICHLFTWILHFLSRLTFSSQKDNTSGFSLEQHLSYMLGAEQKKKRKKLAYFEAPVGNTSQMPIGLNLEISMKPREISPKFVICQLLKRENWGLFFPSPALPMSFLTLMEPRWWSYPKAHYKAWSCLLSFSSFKEKVLCFPQGFPQDL